VRRGYARHPPARAPIVPQTARLGPSGPRARLASRGRSPSRRPVAHGTPAGRAALPTAALIGFPRGHRPYGNARAATRVWRRTLHARCHGSKGFAPTRPCRIVMRVPPSPSSHVCVASLSSAGCDRTRRPNLACERLLAEMMTASPARPEPSMRYAAVTSACTRNGITAASGQRFLTRTEQLVHGTRRQNYGHGRRARLLFNVGDGRLDVTTPSPASRGWWRMARSSASATPAARGYRPPIPDMPTEGSDNARPWAG
jgi:hypothetical protein